MKEPDRNSNQNITKEEVNRLLEVGRLLLSVLTKEEIEQLASIQDKNFIPVDQFEEIGNTGVS